VLAQEQTIPQLKKTEMSNEIDYTLDIATYNGPKKPKFSEEASTISENISS